MAIRSYLVVMGCILAFFNLCLLGFSVGRSEVSSLKGGFECGLDFPEEQLPFSIQFFFLVVVFLFFDMELMVVAVAIHLASS